MKPGKTHPQASVRASVWSSQARFVPVVLCLGLLTACVAPPVYDTSGTGDAGSVEANSGATYPSPSPAASGEATTQFNFPLASCGDSASEPSETWYSVFIDGGNVDEIRTRYCGDAISASRKSGAATIQVASFTSYARALSLAKAIGGVVEQTAQAAPTTTAQPTPSTPQPAPAPAPQPQPGGAGSVAIGQAAYLSASEAGVPINIREQASTDAPIQAAGYPGDPVQISNRIQGSDGYPWFEVRSQSGETGWVRGDLIAAQPPTLQSEPSAPEPDPGSADQMPDPAAQSPYPQPDTPRTADSPYGQSPYGQSPYGQSPYNPDHQSPDTAQPGYPGAGQPYPGYPPSANSPHGTPPLGSRSTLTARDPGSQINIRESASLKSRVRYWANAGDPVQISGTARGDDGQIWYQVQFPSGAMGWVRGDLVTAN
jgi:uncharacterized protein YgiM (DUF1202 family)